MEYLIIFFFYNEICILYISVNRVVIIQAGK